MNKENCALKLVDETILNNSTNLVFIKKWVAQSIQATFSGGQNKYDYRREEESVFLLCVAQNSSATKLTYWPIDSDGLFWEAKRLLREAKHLPLISVMVNSARSFTSITSLLLKLRCLSKHKKEFNFTLYDIYLDYRRTDSAVEINHCWQLQNCNNIREVSP